VHPRLDEEQLQQKGLFGFGVRLQTPSSQRSDACPTTAPVACAGHDRAASVRSPNRLFGLSVLLKCSGAVIDNLCRNS